MRTHQSKCDACMEEQRRESWYKKPAAEWDGQFPIGNWNDDKYFWHADELFEYMVCVSDEPKMAIIDDAKLLADIDEFWLTSCRPSQVPEFDLLDYMNDYLPEDYDGLPEGGAELQEAVNNWVKSISPVSYYMTGERLCPDSLRRQLGGESC